jgi:hypothetical protein
MAVGMLVLPVEALRLSYGLSERGMTTDSPPTAGAEDEAMDSRESDEALGETLPMLLLFILIINVPSFLLLSLCAVGIR